MKFHAILAILFVPLSLIGQDKTGGYPYFLWKETYQNWDNFDSLDIETKLYNYSKTTKELEVKDYFPNFFESYNESTFYIEICQESKKSKEKIKLEYFRLGDNQ